MTQFFNNKRFTPLRKNLRKEQPKPEQIIWNFLRNRQLHGYKFRRQVGIGRYVVDFYCPQQNLVIEIDGESHFIGDAPLQDKVRQQEIENLGITILRFTNIEVMRNIEGVMEKIALHLPQSG